MSSSRWQFSPTLAEPKATYETTMPRNRWVEVLVDSPATQEESQNQKLYTYRLPGDLEVKPGDILSVPFGAQVLGAIAIRLLEHPPANIAIEKIRDVEEVVTSGFFPTNYWELLKKVSTYYYTPLMQVVRTALPPGLLTRSQRRIRLKPEAIPPGATSFLNLSARQILELLQNAKTGDYTWQYLQSKVRGGKQGLRELLKRGWVESYLETPRHAQPKQKQAVTLIAEIDQIDLTPRQVEILSILQRQGGELWLNELLQLSKASATTLKALEQKGYITIQNREILRSLSEPEQAPDRAKVLTVEQATALETINNLQGFAQVLLHGVTGSGKTEVYLQAIAPILEQGKSALVLVPEIGLTPQLTDRFRARFGSKVCVYHSALSEGERYDTWRQMLAGEPQVVIGTRSAVFAPLPKLSLIVLDEEHDSSFKQTSRTPTYHARNVALWRAELINCPIILGSATPSLETWIEVRAAEGHRGTGAQGQGSFSLTPNPYPPTSSQSPVVGAIHESPLPQSPKYYLSLSERIQSRPLPPVEVVDMRQELRQGNKSIFSRSLQEALEQLQEQRKQGILFIHRRGHSTFVSCRSCGYVIECPNCDVSLSYHHIEERAPEILRCHYCNFIRSHPENCPECSSPYLKFFGSGTQKVAEELRKLYPELRIIRFDSDTTRTKGSHRTLLTQFANGEADLLVGTQMLTKGLDISQVTLVGIVAADGLLHLSDYRATERTFQTLTQVAGRAGRGDDPGQVILQTYNPEHSVIQAVKTHNFQSFIQTELPQRAELNYPPYGRLILIQLNSMNSVEVQEAAQMLAGWLRPPGNNNSYEILGPAPASIMRIANRFYWQILLKLPANRIVDLPNFNDLRELCPKSVSLTIDVDPINMM
ncbi:primosomal protein N' [Floridanema aerugineum]|uniref:Replication restart protein PriA n=1 Tax=Floridaenema aerugineum BLCC-F46 TaxID=3153654 RepID=A0ABV4XC34_9CYAN